MNGPDRSDLLIDWEASRRNLRIKDDRDRAHVLRLHEAMINWLGGVALPPAVEVLVPPLRSRKRQVRNHSGAALHTLALLDHEQHETVLHIFRTASIPACEVILYTVRPPVDLQLLHELVRAAADHTSPLVRARAVGLAHVYEFPGIETFYARVRRVETDDSVTQSIDLYEDLRRQGYHATFDAESWSWDIRFVPPEIEGVPDGAWASADVPKIVVDAIGLDRTVNYLRQYFLNDEIVPWGELVEDA